MSESKHHHLYSLMLRHQPSSHHVRCKIVPRTQFSKAAHFVRPFSYRDRVKIPAPCALIVSTWHEVDEFFRAIEEPAQCAVRIGGVTQGYRRSPRNGSRIGERLVEAEVE